MTFRLLACGWAMLFAWVHVYWLAGGSLGLPGAIVETRPAPLMFAAALSVPLLTIAGMGALIGPALSQPVASVAGRAGVALVSLFCLIHALPALLLAAGEAAFGRLRIDEYRLYDLALYEPNWLVGGILFGKVWRDWNSHHRLPLPRP